MSTDSIDLDAYCARISYAGSREPTLAMLRALHWQHVSTIPFENLDVLRQRPIRLDVTSLQQKLVRDRRGGYCFEHNSLLFAVLLALGYRVTPLLGRGLWRNRNRPDLPPAPRTHMLLRVDLPEGPFIADVGYGGAGYPYPLQLSPGLAQPSAHGTYRIVEHEHEYELQAEIGKEHGGVYRFSREPQSLIDYEPLNWFTSTSPQSNFTQHLIVSRLTEEGRYIVSDDEFTLYRANQPIMRRRLTSVGALADVLAEYFSLPLGSGADEPIFSALLARWASPQVA
jgi:N-hydroxyarylamine O-acetyltransferase